MDDRLTLDQFNKAVDTKIDDFVDARLVAEQEDEATAMHRCQTMGEWLAELAAWQEALELGLDVGGGIYGGMAARPDRRKAGERRTTPR